MNEEQTTHGGHLDRAIVMAIWLSTMALVAIALVEFRSALDGIGYAHKEIQTLVTVLLLGGILAAIAGLSVLAYRGKIWAITALLVAPPFCIAVALAGFWTAYWHYGLVCDRIDAPNACYARTLAPGPPCQPGLNDPCFERLERACELGHRSACQRLVDQESWDDDQVCEALTAKCHEVRTCGDIPAPSCFTEVHSLEAYRMAEACDVCAMWPGCGCSTEPYLQAQLTL